MTSDTKQAPLHRLYDPEKSLEYIYNRYTRTKAMIEKQITSLQKDREFKKICQKYYDQGYPDWVILSAIMNCVLNIRFIELGYDYISQSEKLLEISNQMKDIVYPSAAILPTLDEQIKFTFIHNLSTYGFELRRRDFRPEVIEKFLRERMAHFSHDIPHDPLFGDPVGKWPI